MAFANAKRIRTSRKQERRVPRRETIKIIYQENLILTSAMGGGGVVKNFYYTWVYG
mgnify:CR=1 FL=1